MNYYIDTEFLEGTQKEKFPISLLRKNTPPTIDLISIGIISEDGREYYAISKDFNLKEAWNRFDLKDDYDVNGDLVKNIKKVYWIRENVLKPIFDDLLEKQAHRDCASNWIRKRFYKLKYRFTFESLKDMIQKYGKTNKQIAEEIKEFIAPSSKRFDGHMGYYSHENYFKNNPPKFCAYYADYDWVAFCWLFGKMMDLPSGFP